MPVALWGISLLDSAMLALLAADTQIQKPFLETGMVVKVGGLAAPWDVTLQRVLYPLPPCFRASIWTSKQGRLHMNDSLVADSV